MRRPDSRWSGAVERPSAFRAGHIPSCYGSYERCALSLVAAVCRWSLLLLSPLLSAACDARAPRRPGARHYQRTFPRRRDRVLPCPDPSPNPIAPEPGDGRVRSRPSSRVHELCTFTEAVALRSQTVLTGSGSHRSCYGGFGGRIPTLPRACLPASTCRITHQLGRLRLDPSIPAFAQVPVASGRAAART